MLASVCRTLHDTVRSRVVNVLALATILRWIALFLTLTAYRDPYYAATY